MKIILLLTTLLSPFTVHSAPSQTSTDHPHLFILSGQSNMTSGISSSFSEAVNAALGEENVAVTMFAKPGQPIRNWDKDWTAPDGFTDKEGATYGSFYPQVMAGAKKSLGGRTPATATLVWMQGEQDAGGTADTYAKSFHNLLDRMKADLGVDEMHFVVGRINDFWLSRPQGKQMREILVKLAEDDPNGEWIDTDDLNQGVNPWGGYSIEDGHFPPQGYRVMGKRFAKQACRLIAPDTKVDPETFAEIFFDSADDIDTHAAVGKKVTGAEPDPEKSGKGAGLAALTDGLFAGSGSGDGAWVAFAPREEPLELVIDLGKPTELQSVAANILVDPGAETDFPKKIIFSTSEDGETYDLRNGRYNSVSFADGKRLERMRAEGKAPTSFLVLTDQTQGSQKSSARYVKLTIHTGGRHVALDEIVLNPEDP